MWVAVIFLFVHHLQEKERKFGHMKLCFAFCGTSVEKVLKYDVKILIRSCQKHRNYDSEWRCCLKQKAIVF